MKISEIKGVLKTTKLPIKMVEHIVDDFYLVYLESKDKLTWIPGEHAIFSIPNKKIKGRAWRAFSIASIPEEGVVVIGTRTGENVSDFKQQMLSLNPGEEVKVRGPFGWFVLKGETSPIVMVARGVGITPIRSLIKQLEKGSTRPVHVIYEYATLFQEELMELDATLDYLTVHFTKKTEETKGILSQLTITYQNQGYYYLSGSPHYISNVNQFLKQRQITSKRILNDPFLFSR